MSRFAFEPTSLAGLVKVCRKRIEDSRGFFSRFYCFDELQGAGFVKPVMQINHTLTRRRGAVRGMHFQRRPHAEDKLVSCLRGEIFDVAVDLRRNSPTFLHWHGERLSADNCLSLAIPAGFAHGFQALTDDCELIYLHTEAYAAEAEGGIQPTDPAVAVHWPLPIEDLSARDASHPLLNKSFTGLDP